MLHMVVVSHGAETCAATDPALGEKARNGLARVEEAAKERGMTVLGAWADAPGHTFYVVVEAPNGHVINTMMIELQVFHWNTVDVRPVTTLKEAIPLAAR